MHILHAHHQNLQNPHDAYKDQACFSVLNSIYNYYSVDYCLRYLFTLFAGNYFTLLSHNMPL